MSIKFYYLRDPQSIRTDSNGVHHRGHPIGVIASSFDAATNMVRFALATGHPLLNFNKAFFRNMAVGRLEKGRTLSLTFNEGTPNGHQINTATMEAIASTADVVLAKKQSHRLEDQLQVAKHRTDWRQNVSPRAGMAARAWLAMAAVPRKAKEVSDTIPSPAPTNGHSVPMAPIKSPPVPSISSAIKEKVDRFVAANKT